MHVADMKIASWPKNANLILFYYFSLYHTAAYGLLYARFIYDIAVLAYFKFEGHCHWFVIAKMPPQEFRY